MKAFKPSTTPNCGPPEVKFIYFEAFDQPWKNRFPGPAVLGLLNADRSPSLQPRLFAANNRSWRACTDTDSASSRAVMKLEVVGGRTGSRRKAAPAPAANVFNVFTDAESSNNHFVPSGFMGDTGDIAVIENSGRQPALRDVSDQGHL